MIRKFALKEKFNMHFAGAEDLEKSKLLSEEDVENILWSFYRIKENKIDIRDLVKHFKKPNIILDSGAYTARTKGVYISIYEYMDFIKMYGKYFDFYVNLDVIYNAKKTLKNQLKMEEEGLEPIPVFHYSKNFGKDKKYLNYYVKRHDYIGLGGIANIDFSIEWFEKVFRILDKYKIRAHAFGIGTQRILRKFGFHSSDTTDWLSGFLYGTIYVLEKGLPKRVKTSKAFIYKNTIEHFGIDYNKLHDRIERTKLNIRVLKSFEKELRRC